MSPHTTKRKFVRLGERLHEIVSVHDHKGKLVHRSIAPSTLEFYLVDLIQIVIGATILAIPVALTQEVWELGRTLPFWRILVFLGLSLLFISIFVYFNYYKHHTMEGYWDDLFKRIILTYAVAFLVVAGVLTLIGQAPWSTDIMLVIKRTIIGAFPASMSAAVVDVMK